MTPSAFEVLVVGGGPVGWACALAAKTSLGRSARVGVIERTTSADLDTEPRAPEVPISARVYTVASGNLRWLAKHGVTLDAGRCAAVTDIYVNGRDGAESLHISASDAGQDELARVVEHEALTLAIAQSARSLGVHHIKGECVALMDGDASANGGAEKLAELADRRLLPARVILLADGAGSALRDAAGLAVTRRNYDQCGVVANLVCAPAHRGAARQWFLPDGSILALLPLPALDGANAVSMVWSANADRARELCALAEAELVEAINRASGDTAQVVRVIGAARSFPLALTRLADPVAPRLLVVGDAAHAMHPLAGQGVNVGLADARCLASVWLEAAKVYDDPGHSLLLSRYRRERYGPTLAMQLATDGLFRLYNQPEHPLLMAAGDAGMRLLGRLPAFRRTLSTAALQ